MGEPIMIPPTVRFYNPQGPERVAVVSVEPTTDRAANLYLLRVARHPSGQSFTHLGRVATFGPYPETDLPHQFAQVINTLRGEGFLPSGLHALFGSLQSGDSAERARAAARLGWMGCVEAVPRLLAAVADAGDDLCSLLDALGAIGDDRAVPVLRPYAARKLLSRRRSAVEALRNLGDVDGLAEARVRALERLPVSVRDQLANIEHTGETAHNLAALAQSVQSLSPQEQGQALDTLYELATSATVAVVGQLLTKINFAQAGLWRGVKSVFKRALLRHDYATFGLLSHAIEKRGRTSKGTTATLKSGYDGVQRQTRIFARQTQDFLRRLAWRYLRNLAKYRPESYAHAAAEALIHYNPGDARGGVDVTSCYLLNRILWGESERIGFQARTMRFYLTGRSARSRANVREEAFPELWDAQPRAYLRVLEAARLPDAHIFAVQALQGPHRKVLQEASLTEVLALLQAPYEPTVRLGLDELERRFDPRNPDWSILKQLLADSRPLPRELGQRWLKLTAPLWIHVPDQIRDFLHAADAGTRSLVVDLILPVLVKDQPMRQALAVRLLPLLRGPETVAGVHETYVRLVREALAAELGALFSVSELIDLIAHGTPGAKAVAGVLLGYRAEAVAELGLEQITTLAQNDVVAVRRAAQELIRSAEELWRRDPSVLFVLVESEWDDTRALAFDLLRTRIDPAALGLDGVCGLLDSNREEVREVGRELVQKHFDRLDPVELTNRLVQHPHPGMRNLALDLVVNHLPEGPQSLSGLRGFFRAALFDLWPQRQVKRRVINFLAQRGLRDEQQAAVVAGILGDVVRVHGRADFEQSLLALVRLKLAYPQLEATVNLPSGGGA
jgi:hypothetical protein